MWLDRDRLPGGCSSRVDEIDVTHVADLAEFDGKWPRILGYRRDGKVMDGHHRAPGVVGVYAIGLRATEMSLKRDSIQKTQQ
jgi:hypothetical protein